MCSSKLYTQICNRAGSAVVYRLLLEHCYPSQLDTPLSYKRLLQEDKACLCKVSFGFMQLVLAHKCWCIFRMYRGVFPKKDKKSGARQFKRYKTIQPETQQNGKKSGWTRLKEALAREGLSRLKGESYEDEKKRGLSFLTGDESHKVWRPKFSLAEVVAQNMKERVQHEQQLSQKKSSKEKPLKLHSSQSAGTPTEKPMGETALSGKSLLVDRHRRKKTLMKRVNFAWKVLQDDPATNGSEDSAPKPGKARWKAAANKLSHEASVKKKTDFSVLVAGLIAEEKEKTAN